MRLTSADAAVSVVQGEVAMQSTVLITLVSLVTQVTLLAWTDVTTVAAVFDCARCLAAWRVSRALARIDALPPAGHRLNHAHNITHAHTSEYARFSFLFL